MASVIDPKKVEGKNFYVGIWSKTGAWCATKTKSTDGEPFAVQYETETWEEFLDRASCYLLCEEEFS